MNEFELIKKYFSRLANNKSSLNLNDDVFFDKSKNLVVTVDTYVEGVHFLDFKEPDNVIKKVLRASISDLICKGVKPKYYFISGSGNKTSFSKKNLQKISKSLKQEQKKFDISISGGDTVFSNKLSFTIVCIGFSKKIIFRNKVKLNDNIYVTGNLGDSSAGLSILKKKFAINKILKNYFKKSYFVPDIPFNLVKKLHNFANSSIDISDDLFSDLDKLINQKNYTYIIDLKKIPISNNLKRLLHIKKLKKISFISQGDDYQILFTADPAKDRIINKISKSLKVKISKIGKICNQYQKCQIIDEKGKKITIKHKGYLHNF